MNSITKEKILCQLNNWYDYVITFNKIGKYFGVSANNVRSYKKYSAMDNKIPDSYYKYEPNKDNFIDEFILNFKKNYCEEDKKQNGLLYRYFKEWQEYIKGDFVACEKGYSCSGCSNGCYNDLTAKVMLYTYGFLKKSSDGYRFEKVLELEEFFNIMSNEMSDRVRIGSRWDYYKDYRDIRKQRFKVVDYPFTNCLCFCKKTSYYTKPTFFRKSKEMTEYKPQAYFSGKETENILKKIEHHFNSTYIYYINKVFKPYCNKAVDILNELVSYTPELEKSFFLPIQYRDEKSIYLLMQLFYDGKVDTMKEALNLFDTQKYREEVINKLSNIESQVTYLKNVVFRICLKLDEISQSISKVNSNINNMFKQNKELLESVEKIKFYSFVTAWNS